MRTAYCREHIDKTVAECGLSENTRFQVKQAAEFEAEHPEFDFSNCGTETVLAVRRINDPRVQTYVIEELIRRREQVDANGKPIHPAKFTEREVKDIISAEYKLHPTSVGGSCEICGCRFTLINKPQKDHDHKTGNQRGLLCMHCNTAIGKFNDDPELLLRAIQYLRKYSQ